MTMLAAPMLPLLDPRRHRDRDHRSRRHEAGRHLPTPTFEPAVHTADLATALGTPPDVPATAAAKALQIVAARAVADGLGPLLLAVTGRPSLPAGFSVL
jgi:hypothetical protein